MSRLQCLYFCSIYHFVFNHVSFTVSFWRGRRPDGWMGQVLSETKKQNQKRKEQHPLESECIWQHSSSFFLVICKSWCWYDAFFTWIICFSNAQGSKYSKFGKKNNWLTIIKLEPISNSLNQSNTAVWSSFVQDFKKMGAFMLARVLAY